MVAKNEDDQTSEERRLVKWRIERMKLMRDAGLGSKEVWNSFLKDLSEGKTLSKEDWQYFIDFSEKFQQPAIDGKERIKDEIFRDLKHKAIRIVIFAIAIIIFAIICWDLIGPAILHSLSQSVSVQFYHLGLILGTLL